MIINLLNDVSMLNRASFSSYNYMSYIYCVDLCLIQRNICNSCNYNLKMMHDSASKRRSINLLSLSFASKLFSKKLLIKCK